MPSSPLVVSRVKFMSCTTTAMSPFRTTRDGVTRRCHAGHLDTVHIEEYFERGSYRGLIFDDEDDGHGERSFSLDSGLA